MATAPGPFLAPHVLIKWGGKLPGGEEWSNQIRMGRVGAGPWPDMPSPTGAPAVTYATAVQTYHQDSRCRISARALLSYVKVNQVGVDGRYSLTTNNIRLLADVPGGSAIATYYPNQVALAVTLRTAFSRGPGHSGRYYLPMPTMTVAADGLISASDQTNVRGAIADFILALNNVSPLYAVSVFSRRAGAPTQRPVTATVVGRALDTQRRRRKGLPETY